MIGIKKGLMNDLLLPGCVSSFAWKVDNFNITDFHNKCLDPLFILKLIQNAKS
jgi:hypothetical protein